MKKKLLSRMLVGTLVVAQVLSGSQFKTYSIKAATVDSDRWKLVWSDEFGGNEIDSTKWGHELGFIRNNEPQEYTADPKNSYVKDGNLVIETLKEGDRYTSASLMTKGKYDVKYGRIEMRAKLPSGPAIWPAFWTLGANIDSINWPVSGEIDILEMWGGASGEHSGDRKAFANAHWSEDGTPNGYRNAGTHYAELPDKAKLSEDYHIYAVEWSSTEIKWFLDDNNFYTLPIDTPGLIDGFNHPHYILVNTAISPNIGGDYSTNTYPQKYEIDYVRVYQEEKSNGEVLNGSFDEDFKNWTSLGAEITSEAAEGEKVVKINAGGKVEQTITGLHSNNIYTLEAIVKTEEAAKARLEVKGITEGGLADYTEASEGEFTKITTTFVTGSNNSAVSIAMSNSGESGIVYADSFGLSRKTKGGFGYINGGFEKGMEPSLSYNNKAVLVDHDAFSGSKAIYIPKMTNDGTSIQQDIIGLLPSTKYTFSAMVKATPTEGTGFIFGVKNHGFDEQTTWFDSTEFVGYKKATVEFTTGPGSTSANVFLYAGWGAEIYMDDLTIEGYGIENILLEQSEFKAVENCTLAINIKRSGAALNKAGEYEVVLPAGWEVIGDTKFLAGSELETITVVVPENLSVSKYALRIKAISEGALIGDIFTSVSIQKPIDVINVKASAATEGATNKWATSVILANNSPSVKIGGTLTLVAPENLAEKVAPVTFSEVAAAGTTIVNFPMPIMLDTDSVDMEFKVTLDNGYSENFRKTVNVLFADKSNAAPVIDGVIDTASEWSNSAVFNLNKVEQTAGSIPHYDPAKLNGTGYVTWDDNNLYVSVLVKDEIHHQPNSGGNIWQGDGIQFAIDPERATGVTGQSHYEYGFALSQEGEQKWSWRAAYGRATGELTDVQANIKRDEANKTTAYEIAVPLNSILADGKKLGSANELGFSLVINNSDGEDTGRGFIQYCGGIARDKDVKNQGSLILSAKPITIENLTNSTLIKRGEEAKVRVRATNNTLNDKPLALIVVLFDQNNRMVSYGASQTSLKSKEQQELEVMMTLPASGNYKIKYLLWDSLDGQQAVEGVDPGEINVN